MKKRRRIKQRWVVAGIVVLLIIAAIAVLYLWQQENIKAAANARRYTQRELEQQLNESREAVESALEQHPGITVRDLTEEERSALRSGELSPEELIHILTGSAAKPGGAAESSAPGNSAAAQLEATPAPTVPNASVSTNTSAASGTPASTEAPHTPTEQELADQRISELIAEVYVMREQYTATLDAMMAQAKAEYNAMPESERTKAKLIAWAGGYSSRAQALEKQCDAKMDEILAEMRTLLKKSGGDMSLINTMAYSYAQEKSIKKSIYIPELEKRGIM